MHLAPLLCRTLPQLVEYQLKESSAETKSAKQDWEGIGRIAHASHFKSPS